MYDIYEPSITYCIDVTNPLKEDSSLLNINDFLSESVISIHWARFLDAIAVSYDPMRIRNIIDMYVEQYRIQELKNYLFQLYLQSTDEVPSGFIKKVYFELSQDSRKTFYQHRSKINSLIAYGEAGINKISNTKYVAKQDFASRVARINNDQSIQKVVTTVGESNSQVELVQTVESVVRPYLIAAGIGNFFMHAFDLFIKFLDVGVNVLGWTLKIIIGICVSLLIAAF